MQEQTIHWRSDALTRIPYSLYTDKQVPEQEQEKIFRGNTWNFLCLDAELLEAGSYRTTFAGTTPVVVVRDGDGEIYAFENRLNGSGMAVSSCLGESSRC